MGDHMTIHWAIAALAAALLAACTTQPTATQQTLLTATATVDSVDMSSRQVRLTDNAGGGSFTVTAGPEVRNLDQLAAGDQVQVDYYDSVTLSMADPADPGLPETSVLAGRAPEGALPGGLAAASTSLVVEVVSYDPATGVARFRTPDGAMRQTTVAPELRAFASQRQPGDRVLVTLTEAMAVTITETTA
jgi:hypothetical protein